MSVVQAVHQVTGSLGNRSVAGWYRQRVAANAREFRRNAKLRAYSRELIAKARLI